MSLFIIPTQSVFGKSFAKPLAKAFEKPLLPNLTFSLKGRISFFDLCTLS